jgi:hypothetical protein
MLRFIHQPIRAAASAAAFVFLVPSVSHAQPAAAPATVRPASTHDGRHGFDFMLGSWRARFRLLRHPLSGSNEWETFDGTILDRSVLGFANIEEAVLYRETGHERAVTVRLFNKKTNAWSIYFGTDRSGALALPATVGSFDEHGVGRFYDREPYHGKPIVVRYLWTHRSPHACHYEQAFSADGGKSWETNWVSDLTRSS